MKKYRRQSQILSGIPLFGMAAAVLILAAAGCSSFLPAGDPPDGNIVDNSEFAVVRDLNDFESRLVIRLSSAAMMYRNFPGGLFIEAEGELEKILYRVAADAAASGRFRMTSEPNNAWRLRGRVSGGRVEVTLFPPDSGVPEWQENASAAILPPL